VETSKSKKEKYTVGLKHSTAAIVLLKAWLDFLKTFFTFLFLYYDVTQQLTKPI